MLLVDGLPGGQVPLKGAAPFKFGFSAQPACGSLGKRSTASLPNRRFDGCEENALPVRKVVIAVDAGRNLAVLVEAAVRNTVLQLRGIDTYQEFIGRHQRAMERQ